MTTRRFAAQLTVGVLRLEDLLRKRSRSFRSARQVMDVFQHVPIAGNIPVLDRNWWRVFLRNLLYTELLNSNSQLLKDQLRSGDPRALARAISMVENRAAGWSELLKTLFPHTGKARVIGLTGAPGSGKSTLVDQLAKHYRKENQTVGIIAVDPTSPYTGGAILGDRIRMQDHYSDPGIFIRSMATRGSLGGLARATADAATVLDASGRDLVMIETVGVGQDEVDIVRLADVTIVILVPGMGDDVQTIKAGIMEIADIFVINKSDREGAERVEREIRAMQSLADAPRPLDAANREDRR